jgi:hypothetical protein
MKIILNNRKKSMKTSKLHSILRKGIFGILVLTLSLNPIISYSQAIPSPKEHFGFNIGDNYKLATYLQTEAYFKKLAVSDRTKLVDMGLTEEGRHQYMLIISSPDNIKNLAKYKDISQKLAHAEGFTPDQARSLAEEGRSVVWIDGGLHATEVVGTHQLIETAWQLISRNDKETTDILNNVIILLVNANPDGQQLVSDWYMKESDTLKRRTNIPRLYQKYAGHDNNRDFYMLSMKESRNISRQLYVEWFPQVLYNHHQSGPAGTVLAGPPYRDPFNYVYDPLLITGIDAVGAAMNNRLNSEGKPGYTSKTGSSYSTWYNGGLRTTAYFHNIIGLLTEIIGSPTPSEIPFVVDRLLPNGATPNPVTPQKWLFRQSIDYSVSLNYAVLNYASRNRSELLFNIYRMGMNSIERGSGDYWTVSPKAIEAMKSAYATDRKTSAPENIRPDGQSFGNQSRVPIKYYNQVLKNPELRDPRVYIIPSDQVDFPTAVRFINALIGSGIQVHKAVSAFNVNGKNYPAGSFIIKTAQSFRPHVIDLFEPQDHPNDLQYPGGPPIPPYDAAGWTLAYQMGVKFDRILEDIQGPFSKIPYGEEQAFEKVSVPATAKAGYLLSPGVNNSFIIVNDLLSQGVQVFRLPGNSSVSPAVKPGTFYVPYSVKAKSLLEKSTTGVGVIGISKSPSGMERILPARIAICNRYGGSMPAGWLSWIMEQFHFPYKMIYTQGIDSGSLRSKFDVIIFPTGAIPASRRTSDSTAGPSRQFGNEDVPAEYKGWSGNISAEKSIPQIKKFMEDGGVVLTIGSSTNLAYQLNLPVKNALTKPGNNDRETALRSTEYYIPGSLLTASIDTLESANRGMSAKTDFYFDSSPVFKLDSGAAAKGIRRLAWFPNETPLHSGWALGQKYLKDGVIAFQAPVGKGKFFAFGPEITFRSQPHGTFKLIFNQLYQYPAIKK